MPLMIKKRHLHRRKVPERCFIVYSKSRFSDQARSVHFCAFCAFLCFFALVENPVDNCFSLWITLYHAVFNTTSLLVYSVRCPCHLSGGGAPVLLTVPIIAVVQHDGKNLFCALFLIFSKNFSAFKTSVFACFHLFCEPLRARAFSLSLKKTVRKIFLKTY